MNDLCTALADALRKAGEKWPEKFKVVGYNTLGHRGCALDVVGIRDLIDLHGLESCTNFTLDHMDAVAAALGYWFDTLHAVSERGGDKYTSRWGACGMRSTDASEWCPDKRSASLAALLAIITHVMEDGK